MLTQEIQEKILEIISETNPDIYVVEIKFKRSKRSVLLIRIDTDNGISLEDCIAVSRKVGRWMDETDIWDFEYSIEVTSPGVGEPLLLKRQYYKEVGRDLRVINVHATVIEGELVEVTDDYIALQLVPPKRKKGVEVNPADLITKIPFADIKEAKVLVSFEE